MFTRGPNFILGISHSRNCKIILASVGCTLTCQQPTRRCLTLGCGILQLRPELAEPHRGCQFLFAMSSKVLAESPGTGQQ